MKLLAWHSLLRVMVLCFVESDAIANDGLVDEKGIILNDLTVEVLVKMAVSQATAGATFVASSGIMIPEWEQFVKH